MNVLHDKITFTVTPDMERKYYYLPFSVPENIETLTLDYSYFIDKSDNRHTKNSLDIGLVAPDGTQVGAAGQKRKHIVVSERFSTPGYLSITPPAGEWKLLVGVATCKKTFQADFEFGFILKERRWLSGDTHVHTHHSDGAYAPEKVFRLLKKKKFDYAIITDHNGNMTGRYYKLWDPKLLVIDGYELTSFNGHVNLWGVKDPLELPFGFNTKEEYQKLAAQARERGCVVSVNHLTCKNCGWHFWETPTEEKDRIASERRLPNDVTFDCCEVWNGPMRIDNVTAVEWWHRQLVNGNRIPAVGGSDFHQNYAFVNLLGNPTTFTYADSDTTEDVLGALRSGRSFITHSPTSTQMYLTVGEKNVGETAVWTKGCKAKLVLKKTKRNHRLVIYNNDTVVLEAKLVGKEEEVFEVELPEKGFVRAEIRYSYNAVFKAGYRLVTGVLAPKDKGLPIPDFYWALTNPVWLE